MKLLYYTQGVEKDTKKDIMMETFGATSLSTNISRTDFTTIRVKRTGETNARM